MVSIFVCLGLGLVLTLMTGFLAFDQLVRLQYARYYQAWVEAREPDGFFWRPPGRSRFYQMNWSGSLYLLTWLFSTPQWVTQDEVAGRYLRRFRICLLVWNIGFLLMGVWSIGHPELIPRHQYERSSIVLPMTPPATLSCAWGLARLAVVAGELGR